MRPVQGPPWDACFNISDGIRAWSALLRTLNWEPHWGPFKTAVTLGFATSISPQVYWGVLFHQALSWFNPRPWSWISSRFFGAIFVATGGVVPWKGWSGVEWSPEYIVIEMSKWVILSLVWAVGEGLGRGGCEFFCSRFNIVSLDWGWLIVVVWRFGYSDFNWCQFCFQLINSCLPGINVGLCLCCCPCLKFWPLMHWIWKGVAEGGAEVVTPSGSSMEIESQEALEPLSNL
jgi:hypothetical protein